MTAAAIPCKEDSPLQRCGSRAHRTRCRRKFQCQPLRSLVTRASSLQDHRTSCYIEPYSQHGACSCAPTLEALAEMCFAAI